MATTEQPTIEPEATRSPEQVFRYSTYVHVGPGAEDCAHAEDGACESGEHFHAYCRLPNQFQHADIRQKALAAKARRVRQLKDAATDSYAILDADIEELHDLLTSQPDATRDALVAELLQKDWWKRQLEASREVDEHDEFEHIDQDRERLAEIDAMEPEARPGDERDELLRHVESYAAAVKAAREEMERPLREALANLGAGELLDRVREERIAADASLIFMDVYSRWQMFVGTLKPAAGRPKARVFEDIAELEGEAPEVVDALRGAFADLEAGIAAGNA